MTRRMLINAQSPEEVRIAIVTDTNLDDYQVEVAERGLTRGNIYRGVIANIQPSLNAAFIDYGAERHGFLAIQDLVPEACYNEPKDGRRRIEDLLERGRTIVIQVVKEAEGQKGAAVTTNLSLAGRYLVLTPFDKTRGVSRKVEDDDVRKSLKQQVSKLTMPDGCGVIVRTNALDQNKAALTRDLSALLRLWKRVETEARKGRGKVLLYSDQDIILKTLRDHLDSSVEEVLVDNDDAYSQAEEYMRAFMPRAKTKLVRYSERVPMFHRFGLERQIERIYERAVELPGGGSLVIDPTEALTAIDVNSGKATGGATQAETAVKTNLEAAAEVARQLRLRDIGGLVVVDFIDMRNTRHQRKVEKVLRDAMKADRARYTVGRISPNGLLEINRQRIQQALHLRTHTGCPVCDGTGRVASPEMINLNLLRRIEARASDGALKKVVVRLHPEQANNFQNKRRQELAALEREFEIEVEVESATYLNLPEQELVWFDREARPRPIRAAPKPLEAKVTAFSLPQSPIAEDDEDEDSEDGKSDGKADGKSKSKRKRRSRRRKPKSAAAGDSSHGENAPQESQSAESPTEQDGGSSGEDGAQGGSSQGGGSQDDGSQDGAQENQGDGAKPRRRSRRRGGRGRRKSGNRSAGDSAAGDAGAGDAGGSDTGGGASSGGREGDGAGAAPTSE